MPLLDHFHKPIKGRLPWESLHSGWATYLASHLIDHWLPPPYIAVEHAHHGRVEIDVTTYDTGEVARVSSGNGGPVATLAQTWSAPPAVCTVPLLFPDRFEVLIYADSDGWELVGAIEFVSPGNKDRPEQRQAFVAKCASYLHLGVSLVVLDIVTSYHFNLHNELLEFLGVNAGLLPGDSHLYAAAYRPVARQDKPQMDVWAEPCAIGSGLPTMPLRLRNDLVVPVEFETTYQEICRRRRII